MKTILTREASNDIENIKDYFLYQVNSPQVASNIISHFYSAFDLLCSSPYLGQKLSYFYPVNPDYADCRFF